MESIRSGSDIAESNRMGNAGGALRLHAVSDGCAAHRVRRRTRRHRVDRAVEVGHRLPVDSCSHRRSRRLCRKPARRRRHVDRPVEHAGYLRRRAVDDSHDASRCRRRNCRSTQRRVGHGRGAREVVAARTTSPNGSSSHRRRARRRFCSGHGGHCCGHRARPHTVDPSGARPVANCAQLPWRWCRCNRRWPSAQFPLGRFVVLGSTRRPCAGW